MNSRHIKIALLASTLMLAGCATQRETMIAATDNLDHGKMVAVDRSATQQMVNVYWVNPPKKKHDGGR